MDSQRMSSCEHDPGEGVSEARDDTCELSRYESALRRALTKRHYVQRADLDDIVQETFVEAYGAVRSRGPPRHPVGWLIAIGRAVASRSMSLRCRGHEHYDEERYGSEAYTPLEDAVTNERYEPVREAIKNLSQDERNAINGFYYEQQPCTKIGGEDEVAATAIRQRLYRARKRLQTELARTLER